MAINGRAYAVDLDRLRAAYGSRDASILRELDATAESFDEFWEGYPLRDALADIVDGEPRAPEGERAVYGYAIETLCELFGEPIPVPGEDNDEIGDPEDLEVDSPLLDGTLPLPVPGWDDTPYARFLTAAQVAEEYGRLRDADLSHDDPEIEEGRRILVAQLKWALDRGRAFVTVANG